MKEHFVGTWKLTNWELQTSSGEVHSYPYGRDAIGTLIYTDTTYMSANLMVKDRPAFEHPNPLKATEKEIMAAFSSFTSYTGTFSIIDQQVIHHVEASSIPNWVGTDLVRNFKILDGGKSLQLTTPVITGAKGKKYRHFLWWEKVMTADASS